MNLVLLWASGVAGLQIAAYVGWRVVINRVQSGHLLDGTFFQSEVNLLILSVGLFFLAGASCFIIARAPLMWKLLFWMMLPTVVVYAGAASAAAADVAGWTHILADEKIALSRYAQMVRLEFFDAVSFGFPAHFLNQESIVGSLAGLSKYSLLAFRLALAVIIIPYFIGVIDLHQRLLGHDIPQRDGFSALCMAVFCLSIVLTLLSLLSVFTDNKGSGDALFISFLLCCGVVGHFRIKHLGSEKAFLRTYWFAWSQIAFGWIFITSLTVLVSRSLTTTGVEETTTLLLDPRLGVGYFILSAVDLATFGAGGELGLFSELSPADSASTEGVRFFVTKAFCAYLFFPLLVFSARK